MHNVTRGLSMCNLLHVHPNLLLQQAIQQTPVPQVDPLSPTGAHLRLLFHPVVVARHDPVVPLRTGDWRRQPDLFVRGLLVQDVVAIGGVEGEDASLSLLEGLEGCK